MLASGRSTSTRRGESDRKESEPIKRRLLNIHEVCEYTRLSVHTLYAMVSQRRMPDVKAGRLTKCDLKAIDGWIEKNSVRPLRT